MTCTFPVDLQDDYYWIQAVVTWQKDEEEHSAASTSQGFWIGGHPDLTIPAIKVTHAQYLPGNDIDVYNLVKNISDGISTNYTIDFYASSDSHITKSDYHIAYTKRDPLDVNEQHSFNTTCTFPLNIPEGQFYVGAILKSQKECDESNNTACSADVVEIIHPAHYVYGRMMYNVDSLMPIRYALMKIFEKDTNQNPIDDRLILETYTDHTGCFGVVLPEGDVDTHGFYVKIFTESSIEFINSQVNTNDGVWSSMANNNTACYVKDDVLNELYYMESDIFSYPQNSSVEINLTASSDTGAFMVHDSVVEGIWKVREFLNIELEDVVTYWPSSDGYTSYDPCDNTIHIAQDDRRDRDVILHEFGHYVAEIGQFGQGSVGTNPIHYWDEDLRSVPEYRTNEQAMNLAFRESWATMFSIAIQYNDQSNYPYSGDTMYQDIDEISDVLFSVNLEYITPKPSSSGQFYEHMNCGALWDIFDDNNNIYNIYDNKDTVSDPSLTKIWTVCSVYQPDNILEFCSGWLDQFPDFQPDDVQRIFDEHKMSTVFQSP